MTTGQSTEPDPSDTDASGATMAATAAGHGAPPRTRSGFEALQGRELGRYVVLERIGAGAMGVVLAAYDPELDRKVALKLLHPRERSRDGHLRLLAEAQALARLSDPHVVAVHDVGVHEGQVFVAMEFVEGQTLARWLAAGRRPWSEVLDVMSRAGRGLAAAHARELVHRDFKPDNVMIGSDGRVRVMDFGLARDDADGSSSSSSSGSASEVDTSQPRQRALKLELTHRGALLGTPAYMAPEQFSRGRGGPAADQYAFCVSLWEGLFGQRPFVGGTVAELSARILAGEITEAPAGSGVPRWLRRAVERGMAVEPERRWPSMQALLHALERGRARARRGRGLVVVTLVGATVASVWGVQRYDELRRERACEAAGASIEQVWNDEAATAVHEALSSTGMSNAEVTMHKLRPWLDAQALAWQAARTQACRSAEVDGSWDVPTYDRARWCLDERWMELEALVAELSTGEVRTVNQAVWAATRLGRVEPCVDVPALARMPAPPVDERAAVEVVRAELSRARALEHMGARDEGLVLARGALARAEALAWLPLVSATRFQVGSLLFARGDYEEAADRLQEAYFEAAHVEAYEVAAGAAGHLVGLLGHRLARHEEALLWSRHEELMVSRLPDVSGLHRAARLMNLANVYLSMGAYDQAAVANEQALRIHEQALGPDNPTVGDNLINLANVHYTRGAYAEAKALHERGLRIRETSLGLEHPLVADALSNLAAVHIALGEHEHAKALLERAVALQEALQGSDHPNIASSLNNLASVHWALGDYEPAARMFERALQLQERTLGPKHPRTASTLSNLADTLRILGEDARARELFERALLAKEAGLGPDHPDLAFPLQGLSSIARKQGRFHDAVTLAERAVRVRDTAGTGSDFVAEARFELAQAQWEQGQDRGQALAQARRAAQEYAEHGATKAKSIAEIEQWIVEHAP
jgi:tetratricopeptide (TPR) repeat protein